MAVRMAKPVFALLDTQVTQMHDRELDESMEGAINPMNCNVQHVRLV